MNDLITLTGLIATVPRHVTTNEGLSILSFRLASTQRRYDRGSQRWVDGDTNWFTVTAFRQLATNCATSLTKGERIVVTGRLRVREWTTEEKSGLNVEVEADAIGHDLSWGTTTFVRTIVSTSIPSAGQAQEQEAVPSQETRPQENQAASAGAGESIAPGEAWAVAGVPASGELAEATVPF